ncbi:uncharacterized protein C8R40DRAFT_1074618 [Lentinula edodes]|uniref:uncharacterized protein n=1 Tax=Lentinula edodes TaxID=5353 RepID=UPI001E8D5EEF|nr:uncharacterized protein C8R40DRAFT_1074618 [Lentinula edodes]KAH7868743.1 hypothetical protein C8R40DRAFT_1074618 [Lentinula edodes]
MLYKQALVQFEGVHFESVIDLADRLLKKVPYTDKDVLNSEWARLTEFDSPGQARMCYSNTVAMRDRSAFEKLGNVGIEEVDGQSKINGDGRLIVSQNKEDWIRKEARIRGACVVGGTRKNCVNGGKHTIGLVNGVLLPPVLGSLRQRKKGNERREMEHGGNEQEVLRTARKSYMERARNRLKAMAQGLGSLDGTTWTGGVSTIHGSLEVNMDVDS